MDGGSSVEGTTGRGVVQGEKNEYLDADRYLREAPPGSAAMTLA